MRRAVYTKKKRVSPVYKRKPTSKTESAVYLIHNERANMVKIGISKNPENRLRNLETGGGCKLKLVFYTKMMTTEVALRMECKMHDHYRGVRQQGEWFDDVILAHADKQIRRINDLPGHKLEARWY